MEEPASFADVAHVLNRLLLQSRGKPLSSAERDTLEGIWHGQSYEDMGTRLHKSPASLKQTAYSLWQPLTTVLGVKVRKGNFRSVMQDYLLQPRDGGAETQEPAPEPKAASRAANPIDLGGLDCTATGLLGRGQDIEKLLKEIQGGCQLLLVTGSLRIGKTQLIGLLVNRLDEGSRLQDAFDCVLYRRASDVPTLDDWYRDFIRLIDRRAFPEALSESTDSASQIRLMMRVLQEQRCLLIVDRADMLYQPRGLAGQFQDRSAGYSTFLTRVAEDSHRSCLVWVGRTSPNTLIEVGRNVRHHSICGLPYADAMTLLDLQISQEQAAGEWSDLVTFCGGNPRFLQAAKLNIERFHNGSVRRFLNAPMLLSDPFNRLLGELWDSLSDPEISLLYWITLDPLASEHFSQIIPSSSFTRAELGNALGSLWKRNLLAGETNHQGIQPPIFAAYVAQRLVESLAQEVRDAEPDLLHRYPILIASAPAYQVAQQRATVVQPLVNRLCEEYGSNYDALYLGLKQVLHTLKQENGRVRSYATGNLLNIVGQFNLTTSIHLKLLERFDFSGLTVRQADLQYTNLQQVSLANCIFRETRFASGLQESLLSHWSEDGATLAVADIKGHCLVWQFQQAHLELTHRYCLPDNIYAIALGPLNRLAVATADQTIHIWQNGQPLIALVPPPASSLASNAIQSLCLNGTGDLLAAGFADGRILVWQLSSESNRPIMLHQHTSAVIELAFSQDGQALASLEEENRLLVWDLSSGLQTQEFFPAGNGHSGAFAWTENEIRVATIYPDGIHLQNIVGLTDSIIKNVGKVLALALSVNGQYLAVSDADCAIQIWDLERNTSQVLPELPDVPVALQVNQDGTKLLASTPTCVWLWDTANQHCLWEVRAIGDELLFYENCNLRGVDLPVPVRAIAADLGAIV